MFLFLEGEGCVFFFSGQDEHAPCGPVMRMLFLVFVLAFVVEKLFGRRFLQLRILCEDPNSENQGLSRVLKIHIPWERQLTSSVRMRLVGLVGWFC